MRYYNPSPTFGHSLDPARVDPTSSATWRIGLVDDGLDPPFTDELLRLLNERSNGSVRLFKKPSGTAPSPKQLIEDLVGSTNSGVVGVGL